MIEIIDNLTKTAYHEAAHAVAAFEFGKRIRKVSIKPNGDYLGCCIGYSKLPPLDGSEKITPVIANKVQERIITDFAGILAEQRLSGKRQKGWSEYSDIKDALELAMCVNDYQEEAQRYIGWLLARATSIIYEREDVWKTIQAIAEELLKKETLSGKEAFEIWQNT